MAGPKISATLNNCSLHLAVSYLRQAMNYYADPKAKGFSDVQRANLAKLSDNYAQLKASFAKFYGLDNTQFSWRAFAKAIDDLKSPYAQQMVMGPVLREFMRENINNPELKTKLCTIQQDGRYMPLTGKQAAEYVYQPLGLSVTEHTEVPVSVNRDGELSELFKATHQVFKVDSYLRDQHFELNPKQTMPSIESGLTNMPKSLADIRDKFTSSSSKHNADEVLAGLKSEIKQSCEQLYLLTAKEQSTLNSVSEGHAQQLKGLFALHKVGFFSNVVKPGSSMSDEQKSENTAMRLQAEELDLFYRN